jgi:hypothetical protein
MSATSWSSDRINSQYANADAIDAFVEPAFSDDEAAVSDLSHFR